MDALTGGLLMDLLSFVGGGWCRDGNGGGDGYAFGSGAGGAVPAEGPRVAAGLDDKAVTPVRRSTSTQVRTFFPFRPLRNVCVCVTAGTNRRGLTCECGVSVNQKRMTADRAANAVQQCGSRDAQLVESTARARAKLGTILQQSRALKINLERSITDLVGDRYKVHIFADLSDY